MTLFVSVSDVRNKNKEYLMTDGISDETIESTITDVQIKVFNKVGHLYDFSEITTETCPDEIKLAIKDWSAGQLLIDEFDDNEQATKKGTIYREDAISLLSNIVKGSRRFDTLKKQQQKNTIASTIVFSNNDSIEKFISDIKSY
jgi:hypothetical protein